MLRVSRRAAGVQVTGRGEDCGWCPAPEVKVGVVCYGLVVVLRVPQETASEIEAFGELRRFLPTG